MRESINKQRQLTDNNRFTIIILTKGEGGIECATTNNPTLRAAALNDEGLPFSDKNHPNRSFPITLGAHSDKLHNKHFILLLIDYSAVSQQPPQPIITNPFSFSPPQSINQSINHQSLLVSVDRIISGEESTTR